MSKLPVALQLYTVREDAARDFVGTLRRVAEIGYPGVQLAGTFGLSAAELRSVLDDLGLRVAGNHIGLDRLEHHLQEEIAYNLTIGNRDIVCPMLPPDRRPDRAGYLAAARLFNEIGAHCRESGLRFSYHNHAFEFETFDGEYGLDILYGATDPELVLVEVDTYWAYFAGVDPAAYIRKYPGRQPLVHLKDMNPADRSFAEVGEGCLDWPAIFAACEAAGVEWYVVEQDRCQRPALESARLSLDNLRKMGVVA